MFDPLRCEHCMHVTSHSHVKQLTQFDYSLKAFVLPRLPFQAFQRLRQRVTSKESLICGLYPLSIPLSRINQTYQFSNRNLLLVISDACLEATLQINFYGGQKP